MNTENDRHQTLVLRGRDFLPVILAQHLFTSFMWTVVENMPSDCLRKEKRDLEIVDNHKFDPRDMRNTWQLPTLRHRKLVNAIRDLESFGLGNTTDILLCIIPALSSRDLLPNEQFLELVPQIDHNNKKWIETARYYKELLHTPLITRTKEQFSFAVAVRAIDFLHLAFEPYLDTTELDNNLQEELVCISTALVQGKLREVVDILAPVYEFQNRAFKKLEAFKCLMLRGNIDRREQATRPPQIKKNLSNHSAFTTYHEKLGFTKLHQDIFDMIVREKSPDLLCRSGLGRNTLENVFSLLLTRLIDAFSLPDIFGWTAVHYMCLPDADNSMLQLALRIHLKGKPFHEYFDRTHRSPIHTAVLSGRRYALKIMIDCLGQETAKNVITQPGVYGMTPLHLAARAGSLECMQQLMEHEKNITTSALDIWGRQALHIATKHGYTDVVPRLLEDTKVDVKQVDAFGKSSLVYLLQSNPKAVPISTLLKFVTAAKGQTDNDGKTLLHVAAEFAYSETLGILLQLPELVLHLIIQDRYGRTPLILAVIARRTEIARRLSGASIRELIAKTDKSTLDMATIADHSQMTALHHALANGMDELAAHLLKASDYERTKYHDGKSVLIMACMNKCVRSVQKMVRKWPELINEKDEHYGRTPLFWACRTRNLDVVRWLFSCKGLDPNIPAKSDENYSSLHMAVSSNDSELVDYLSRKGGVDYGASDFSGRKPLDLAVQMGNHKMVKILCSNRPNTREAIKALGKVSDIAFIDLLSVMLQITRDSTPRDDDLRAWVDRCAALLHMSQGQEILSTCLARALKRSTWDGLLRIPFHRAAQAGQPSTIRWMKEQGADIEKLDSDNWSWVDYGRRYCNERTWEELKALAGELGISSTNTNAQLPSTFTARKDNENCFQLIPCQDTQHDNSDCRLMGKYLEKMHIQLISGDIANI